VPADADGRLLSFINLVELHVLSSLRRQHLIRLNKIRRAIDFLASEFKSKHPLADHEFLAGGTELFVQRYGELINLSQKGQLGMTKVLEDYLERVSRDPNGAPIRLYPFARAQPNAADPRVIAIDPRVRFGRPVIERRAIPTDVIAERYKAGEMISELAEDFRCKPAEIEEAIRYEFQQSAA
jgi:uncharacterized protein (DUF433 family)